MDTDRPTPPDRGPLADLRERLARLPSNHPSAPEYTRAPTRRPPREDGGRGAGADGGEPAGGRKPSRVARLADGGRGPHEAGVGAGGMAGLRGPDGARPEGARPDGARPDGDGGDPAEPGPGAGGQAAGPSRGERRPDKGSDADPAGPPALTVLMALVSGRRGADGGRDPWLERLERLARLDRHPRGDPPPGRTGGHGGARMDGVGWHLLGPRPHSGRGLHRPWFADADAPWFTSGRAGGFSEDPPSRSS